MSEDRMNRAERIRNMREGNRGTDDEPADSDAEAAPGTGAPNGGDSEPDPTPADGEPEPTGTDSEPEPATADTGTEQPTPDPEPSTTAGSPSVTEEAAAQVPESEGVTDDEASAVAQRAAAAAADVMGAGGETEAPTQMDDTPDANLIAQGPSGVELPDQELLEEAMAGSAVESTEGGARAAIEGTTTAQDEELVRVLEFSLGDEYYCLDIEYVEEIVKRETVTRVPNTPEFVEGVVDLRGQITTILEPKEMMDIDAEGEQNLIVVFDPEKFEEQGAVGWVVDEVRQVVPVTESEVNDPPVDAEYINGVVDRDEYDQFVIWIEPDDALEQATGGEEE